MPRRYGGVTLYQTDWSLAAVTLSVKDGDAAPGSAADGGVGPLLRSLAAAAGADDPSQLVRASPDGSARLSLPLASLAGKGSVPEDGKLWATFLPLEAPGEDGRPPRGISRERRPPARLTTRARAIGAARSQRQLLSSFPGTGGGAWGGPRSPRL